MVWPADSTNNKPINITKEWKAPPPTKDKKIEMTIMWGDVPKAYQIISIKNTIYYRPGIWLSEEIVAKCCELPNWEVTVIEDQFWSNLLGFISSKLPGIAIPGI